MVMMGMLVVVVMMVLVAVGHAVMGMNVLMASFMIQMHHSIYSFP